MNVRPIMFRTSMVQALIEGRKTQTRRIVKPQPNDKPQEPEFLSACRYGRPGDLLWVRETFCESPDGPIYRASKEEAGQLEPADRIVWKPSIFMPRALSRLTLRITDVRVQRVQDLSANEVFAEGVQIPCDADTGRPLMQISGKHAPSSYLPNPPYPGDIPEHDFVLAHWGALWGSVNGRDKWNENPWLWALTFEVIRANVDEVCK